MLRAIVFSVLMVLSTNAFAKAYHFVPILYDPGGEVSKYAREMLEAAETDTIYGIKGKCFSACTIRLSRACVYPTALIGFHSPYIPKNYEQNEAEVARVRELMYATYPKAIQAWVSENGAIDSSRKTYLTGTEAIRLGIPDCRRLIGE